MILLVRCADVWTRKTELQVRAAYGLEVDAAAQAGPVLYSVSDCHGWCIEHHGTPPM